MLATSGVLTTEVTIMLIRAEIDDRIFLKAQAPMPPQLQEEAISQGLTVHSPYWWLFNHLFFGLAWLWWKGLPGGFWQMRPLLWWLRRTTTYRVGDGDWLPCPAFEKVVR